MSSSNEQLKIELALKILDKIDWNVETITVIETKVNLVRSILSHPVFWTPKKKKTERLKDFPERKEK